MLDRVRPRREVTLGPVRLKEGALVLRSPRLRDARAWSQARLANREWLERAFPAWGDDWAAEQSPSAWVERWWHLQTVRRTSGALPFVLLLDGRLIGELGIDAVDTASGGGEASVWMVRDHGSAGVMNVASLLLIQHAFQGAAAMDRLISPVASTSRKGRAPGLTAVGFDIEATLPRPVGRGPAVDHDIWVLHNSPSVRAKADQALAAMARGEKPPVPAESRLTVLVQSAPLVPAVARALFRGLRSAVRERLARRGAVRPERAVTDGGRTVGRLTTTADVGTATGTIRLQVSAPDALDAFADAIAATADDVATWGPGSRWVEVRLTPGQRAIGEALAAHGFTHVATYRGNPDGPRRWPGEHSWSRPV